jgi:hypothetical protein
MSHFEYALMERLVSYSFERCNQHVVDPQRMSLGVITGLIEANVAQTLPE